MTKEFSIENIESYKDILAYQQLESFSERKEKAIQMKEIYFNGMQSSLEVNVDGKNLRELNKKFEENSFESDLFDEIESKILENLSDTYSRMIISHDYLNLQNRNEFFGSIYLVDSK
jgi:GrpB-like predicted nucleotidyltransferase (UPF0157 family)